MNHHVGHRGAKVFLLGTADDSSSTVDSIFCPLYRIWSPIRTKTNWNYIHLFPGMWCCFGEHRDGQEAEEGFFLENGGRVLEELVTTFNGKYNPFRIFSKRELSAATNKYHSGGILHKGFTYILYEGTHEDRPISVKKFAESSAQDYIDWYVNEVAVA